MKNVGFIGWRGMVGSVLMDRMVQENDFTNINPVFFTTSQVGQKAPVFAGKDAGELKMRLILQSYKNSTLSLLVKAVIIPMKFIRN